MRTRPLPNTFDFKTSPALVFYVADWCGHCQQLKQSGVIGRVAAAIGSVIPVYVAKDNTHAQVMKEQRISGFPTIVYYNGQGKAHVFDGLRASDRIISFVCERSLGYSFC
jgi:protein disulfide-isomerase A6